MEDICITWLSTALINNSVYYMLQKLLRPLDKEVLIKFQHNVSNGKSKTSFNPLSSHGNRRFKTQVLAAGLE
jgi:hypothetical protein